MSRGFKILAAGTLVFAFMLGLASAFMLSIWVHPSSRSATGQREGDLDEAVHPPNSAPDQPRSKGDKQLLQRIADLEARLEGLEEGAAYSDDDTEQAEAPQKPEVAAVPHTAEQLRVIKLQRIERLDEVLDREQQDPGWSGATVDLIRDTWSRLDLQGSVMTQTHCGATFCRVDVDHEDRDAEDDFHRFVIKVPSMGARTVLVVNEDGSRRTVAYFLRKEHDSREHPARWRDKRWESASLHWR